MRRGRIWIIERVFAVYDLAGDRLEFFNKFCFVKAMPCYVYCKHITFTFAHSQWCPNSLDGVTNCQSLIRF